jgi:putative CocE/NonD family hydrolase
LSRIVLTRDVEIPMRDGTILRADVSRADDGPPQPVVLIRTVYNKDRVNFAPWGGVTKRGFAFVIQDCRGMYRSDGDWTGLRMKYEADDGYDTIEWIAAQPWCDGKVFMVGVSALGVTTLLAATARPPHLVAIAPWQVTEASLFRRETGGGFVLELLVTWLLAQIARMGLPRALAAGKATMEDVERVRAGLMNPDAVTGHLPIATNPYLDVPGAPLTIAELLATEPFTAVPLERIAVPTQLLG